MVTSLTHLVLLPSYTNNFQKNKLSLSLESVRYFYKQMLLFSKDTLN